MSFLKIPETTLQQKTMGQKQWVEVAFRYDLPRLSDNKFDPNKKQLAWGIQSNGEDMMWYISQTSIEKALNLIGPKTGTVVKVCKVRTGTEQKEVEYEVEFVIGETEPRDIRQLAEAAEAANNGATQQPTQPAQPAPQAAPPPANSQPVQPAHR